MADATLVVESDDLVDVPRARSFLRLRSVGLRIEHDGQLSERGVWEFVERPAGLDAVVVVVWRRAQRGVEVLLRRGLRVPTALGRAGQPRGVGRHPASLIDEIVAGLVEAGEDTEAGLLERAREEVREEVGLDLPRTVFTTLGAPLWATPGLCAEVLHWFAADATGATATTPAGDGSPFEMVSERVWLSLDDAIAAAVDLRAELAFRRLAATL